MHKDRFFSDGIRESKYPLKVLLARNAKRVVGVRWIASGYVVADNPVNLLEPSRLNGWLSRPSHGHDISKTRIELRHALQVCASTDRQMPLERFKEHQ